MDWITELQTLTVFTEHDRNCRSDGAEINVEDRGPRMKQMGLVSTVWRLGEVQTQQVVSFGAVLPVAHHQLASLPAAEAEVLVCVLALRPQLPLLGLQLGVPGLLLLLHHHHALQQESQSHATAASDTLFGGLAAAGARFSPSAARRGTRSSCPLRSYRTFFCCPRSAGCS